MTRGVVWFRRDLRLDHNPAWAHATAVHDEVEPVFVLEPALLARSSVHKRDQLLAHVRGLNEALAGRLCVTDRAGVIERANAADGLYLNTDVTPFARRRDAAVLAQVRVPVRQQFGSLVQPPGAVLTQKGIRISATKSCSSTC